MPSQTEIRQSITNQIIDALKSGCLPPWRRPWALDPNCGSPRSLSTLKVYRGINVLILAIAAMKNGFRSRWWGSYQAIRDAGGYVRKGEKASHVILFRPISKTVVSEDTGEEEEERFAVMRTFAVFNIEQANGLDYLRAGRTELAPAILDERYEKADAAIAATKADIRFGGNEARYNITGDFIELPYRHQFASTADFWETLAHEMAHWTGHATRLNRDQEKAKSSYALEELVAEIGACFLCAELGLPTADSLDNHHAYVKSWIAALENDPRCIFTASAQASKAVDFVLSFNKTPVEEPEAVLA
jgi:antirestriction protein ArdC